jgi:hypothetical protein
VHESLYEKSVCGGIGENDARALASEDVGHERIEQRIRGERRSSHVKHCGAEPNGAKRLGCGAGALAPEVSEGAAFDGEKRSTIAPVLLFRAGVKLCGDFS